MTSMLDLQVIGIVGFSKKLNDSRTGKDYGVVTLYAENPRMGEDSKKVRVELLLLGKLINALPYATKGRLVLARGDLILDHFVRSDGSKDVALKLRTEKLKFLDAAPETEQT